MSTEPTNDPVARFRPGAVEAAPDGRLFFPAAGRNIGPITACLSDRLAGMQGTALEIGSGTGQHVCALARALPGLRWTATDPDPGHLDSIRAWARHEDVEIGGPLPLDAARNWPSWPPLRAHLPCKVIFSANVIHIAPFAVARGIFRGAAEVLDRDGQLILYGPFRIHGRHVSEGNVTFDGRLRAQDPSWGIRDIDDLEPLAVAGGLALREMVEMPANNRILIWARA